MKTTAFFAGTFDPPTLGHLYVITTASRLFSRILVGIALDSPKQALFSVEERTLFLQKAVKEKNVEIISFRGLTVRAAIEQKAQVLIRGIRSARSVDTELEMAEANQQIGSLPTLLIPSDRSLSHISSSLVKEIARAQGPIGSFVPSEIASEIAQKFFRT
jgi:pantetheine-phosphate adenylyltransferase